MTQHIVADSGMVPNVNRDPNIDTSQIAIHYSTRLRRVIKQF